jgi:hypothetical protein
VKKKKKRKSVKGREGDKRNKTKRFLFFGVGFILSLSENRESRIVNSNSKKTKQNAKQETTQGKTKKKQQKTIVLLFFLFFFFFYTSSIIRITIRMWGKWMEIF